MLLWVLCVGACWDYLQLIDLIDLVGLWLRGFEFPAGVVGLVFLVLVFDLLHDFLDFGVFWFACWVVCVYVCASERCVLCLCLGAGGLHLQSWWLRFAGVFWLP